MKTRVYSLLFLLLVIGGMLFGTGTNESTANSSSEQEITVYIAASTTDLITEISHLYSDKTGVKVNINPASSGTLARQIEQGAPAQIFISASKKWMDYVVELGVVEHSGAFVKNRLVLITPLDSPLSSVELNSTTDLPSLFSGKISMGDPAHVPAGKYAEEALKYFGWYEPLIERILPAADVRAALAVVELGETDTGIVYETDAKKSEKVAIAGYFPEESHTPVEYFIATLEESGAAARRFYDFIIADPAAAECCTKYGFTLSS